MTSRSVLSQSKEYTSFRASVSQKKIIVSTLGRQYTWQVFDVGPREVRCPLICLPPNSGTADIFFHQLLALSCQGYRVLALHYPIAWTHEELCSGLEALLDHLHLDQVHIFGAGLGGFLAQKFAESTQRAPRVRSIVLCNAYVDAATHQPASPTVTKLLPAFMLKRSVLANLPETVLEAEIAHSIDFVVERLELLERDELASRLVLGGIGYVQPQTLAAQDLTLMILTSLDDVSIPVAARAELAKCYPDAKSAELKDGGVFPFLSRPDQVNMFLQVHLRQFAGTRHSAIVEPTSPSPTL
eukprot:m.23059 g.23059  ORF g.23059 m.23059 type:complete len:299 (-) comp8417_c0_seq2:41-937(-)